MLLHEFKVFCVSAVYGGWLVLLAWGLTILPNSTWSFRDAFLYMVAGILAVDSARASVDRHRVSGP